MFGYRMQVFKQGRLASGPVKQSLDGRLNLKNPACYVFPGANNCAPGEEFSVTQQTEAEAFAAYRPYHYAWPVWQYAAAVASWVAAVACLLGCLPVVACRFPRRGRK
jgi:hypothetical protein